MNRVARIVVTARAKREILRIADGGPLTQQAHNLSRTVLLKLVPWLFVVPALGQGPMQANATANPPGLLHGRVVDMRGNPVPASRVWVVTENAPASVLAQGMGDGDGCFRFRHMHSGEGQLIRATADGKSTAETVLDEDPGHLMLLVHDAATLRGVLQNRAGQPVPGTVVRVVDRSCVSYAADCFATTDATGAFALERVPLGPVEVSAVVPEEGLYSASMVVSGDGTVSLRRADIPTTTLELRVRGLRADLLPSVRVFLQSRDDELVLPPPWHQPRLGDNGTCSLLGLPNIPYSLHLECPGFAFSPEELTLVPGEGPHVVDFRTQALSHAIYPCCGVICGSDDRPLAGVRLQLRALWPPPAVEATSDDAGRFELPCHFTPGKRMLLTCLDDRWVLLQSKDEGALKQENPQFFGQHEWIARPDSPVELHAVQASSVSGRVLLANGDPAPFVDATLEYLCMVSDKPMWLPAVTSQADHAGRFVFRGLVNVTEHVRIAVDSELGSGTSGPLALTEAGTNLKLRDLRLAAPATVEGVVRDAQGRPCAGVLVMLQRCDGASGIRITDRLGRYRFLGVSPGSACLEVQRDGDQPDEPAAASFEVAAGKTCTVDLKVTPK